MTAPAPAYVYAAQVLRTVDGDTYEVRVDCGFDVAFTCHIRLLGVNCPEHDAPGGPEATAFVTDLFASQHQQIIVATRKNPIRSFARYVATVWVGGQSLAQILLDTHHAVPMDA